MSNLGSKDTIWALGKVVQRYMVAAVLAVVHVGIKIDCAFYLINFL